MEKRSGKTEKIKTVLPVLAAVLATALLFTGMALRQTANSFTNEDFIRFHVIANSDSDEDQALKLKVRDRLVEYVNDGLRREVMHQSDGSGQTAEFDIEQTRDYIESHIDAIQKKAEEIVRSEGCLLYTSRCV